MPELTISRPENNAVIVLNQPFQVSGIASETSAMGGAEPRPIDTVRVQVDGGPATEANLTALPYPDPERTETLVAFDATIQVAGGADPHVITVTATSDMQRSVTKFVSVFAGTPFPVGAPALVLELRPGPLDPNDQNKRKAVDFLVSQVQMRLTNMASLLASRGETLVGPNLVLAPILGGGNVLRIGMWIVPSDFPVVAPRPPDFPLPVLADDAAASAFATAPMLPLPKLTGTEPLEFAFGAFVPTATLQKLVDALFPTLKARAARNGVSLESVRVSCKGPGSVITSFSGTTGFHGAEAQIGGTVTEVLGTVTVPGSKPPQQVPAITSSSFMSTSDVLAQALLGFLHPVYWAEALFIAASVPAGVETLAGKVTAMAGSFVRSIPASVPIQNTFSRALSDFLRIVPTWTFFGTTNSGMRGLGLASIAGRNQSMVGLTLSGPADIYGHQFDLASGASQAYGVTWPNLVPDGDKFTWSVSGSAAAGGAIGLAPLTQAGSFVATFPLPAEVLPGTYDFTLAVNAIETARLDPSKTLTGSTLRAVRVHVAEDPSILP